MFCSKCGYFMPDGSEHCARCGEKAGSYYAPPPPQSYQAKKNIKKASVFLAIGAALAIIVVLLVLSRCGGSGSTYLRGGTSTPAQTAKYIEFTPAELQMLYDDNAMRFDRDIMGGNVAVTGIVEEISSSSVKLRVNRSLFSVSTLTCEIASSSQNYVADNLRTGDTVTLYGKVSSSNLSNLFDDYIITSCSTSLPANAIVISPTEASISGVGKLNGTYSGDLGLMKYTFRGEMHPSNR